MKKPAIIVPCILAFLLAASVTAYQLPSTDAALDGLTGSPVEVFCETINPATGVHLPVCRVTYDCYGRTEERSAYGEDGVHLGWVEYDRDESGLRTGSRTLSGARHTIGRSIIIYDMERLIVQETDYDSSGTPRHSIETTYDENGRVRARVLRREVAGHQSAVVSTAFDEYGNAIGEEELDSQGNVVARRTFVYELDGYDNWIRRDTYEDGRLTSVMYRSIAYRGWT